MGAKIVNASEQLHHQIVTSNPSHPQPQFFQTTPMTTVGRPANGGQPLID